MARHEEVELMDSPELLRFEGEVEHPIGLTIEDLDAIPESDRVLDVSRFQPNRKGDGVTLDSLLDRVVPKVEATHLTLHADRDDFHVSIPLDVIRGQGVVVYRIGPSTLGPEQGGPVRLLIRDPSACHTGELDDCANVKYLSRVELTTRKGLDTRPLDEEAHRALHEGQS
ncbi:molybdopterin-dependent oxidoreductase [Tundrisphaera lichenicola]|uniref:molybdopterin-dependent oxidoreductase n=1 Tax=Tundrisphaera lichenicola TaxID=2029860 RepID=UPI003EBBA02A